MVMPKYFKTVGTKIADETHAAFKKYCAEHGISMHQELKEHVEGMIEKEEKIERNTEGLEKGSRGDIQTGSSEAAEEHETTGGEWGDCPFC